MPRVKCPHCGAGNQDATEADTCWQCGNVLGAPRVQTAAARPMMSSVSPPTQQLDPSLLQNLPTGGNQASGTAPKNMTTAIVVTVLIVAALIILFFVLASRR